MIGMVLDFIVTKNSKLIPLRKVRYESNTDLH